ncbi:maternal protein exuperantia [Lutzomyia longipalpis]|uniref:maternal protein exuperantia n=1 Tax=Lutzomyia longipalpis TaxID=7200 RepID=UPI002483AF19|nr:maternal protein exuperantia [Lutzomyia longipalpis]
MVGQVGTSSGGSLPEGKYTIVSVDIDATGRRLIDEIVHLAAYTPDSEFSQYVMPYMNLNPAARQRHQVRVITIGFFRMLKSMQTYKVMKTKPEYAALVDFMLWLEEQKARNPDSKGIIMLYHEQRKFVPYMLLEALKKYDMLPRFKTSVVGFTNVYPLAEKECGVTLKYFTLKELKKVILQCDEDDRNEFEGSAKVRSKIAYDVSKVLANKPSAATVEVKKEDVAEAAAAAAVQQPEAAVQENCVQEQEGQEAKPEQQEQQEQQVEGDGEANKVEEAAQEAVETPSVPETQEEKKPAVVPVVKEATTEKERTAVFHRVITGMATTIDENLQELGGQQTILDRQNSLRTIFVNYFKTTLYHRVRGVTFRRVLAEQGFDMTKLQDIWGKEKRDGIRVAVAGLRELKEDDKKELTDLLDCHFDPEKQPIKPVSRKTNKRRFQRRQTSRISPRKRNVQKGRNNNQQHHNGENHQGNHNNNNYQQHGNNHQGGRNQRGTPQKRFTEHKEITLTGMKIDEFSSMAAAAAPPVVS